MKAPPSRQSTKDRSFMDTVLPRRFRFFLDPGNGAAIDEKIVDYLHHQPMATKEMLRRRLRCRRSELDRQLGLLEHKGFVDHLSIGPRERYFSSKKGNPECHVPSDKYWGA